jgi:hypothetical protein
MRLAFIRIDNKASGSFWSRGETGMPGKFTRMSKKSKPMPRIRHRPRASSTSFSGNCGAKFGRKLKNLSETTADDTDNAGEETPATRSSSGVAEGPAATRFSLQGRSALRKQLSILSFIAAEVALGGNVRVGHATVRVDDSNCLSVNLGAASRLVLVLIAAHVEIERNARSVVVVRIKNPERSPLTIHR